VADIKATVVRIVVERLNVGAAAVTAESRFINDLGADSLDIVELVMEFEEAFDMTIPDEDSEKIRTVGEAVSYIESKVGGDGGQSSNSPPTWDSNDFLEPFAEDAQQEPPPGTAEDKIRHKLTAETRKWNSRVTNSRSALNEAVAKEMLRLIAELRNFLQG